MFYNMNWNRTQKESKDSEGGKFFFNTVREGDSVLFATDDEQDSHNWVMAFYRATGQAHRPAPPVTTGKSSSLNKTQQGDADKARKHGMEEYIAADPITFEHHALFKKLQSLSLDWRLNDSLPGWRTSTTIWRLQSKRLVMYLRVRMVTLPSIIVRLLLQYRHFFEFKTRLDH